MINHTTQANLLHNLFVILEGHRPAFKQDRPFWRAVGLVLGEIFSFGRHTVTQGLLSLGLTEGDWSAWYRLFSRERFDEEQLSNCLLQETLEHVAVDELYCAAIDSTTLHRSSLKMPGTSWLRDTRFSAFRPGIHRAQRFLHGEYPVEKLKNVHLSTNLCPASSNCCGGSTCHRWQRNTVRLHLHVPGSPAADTPRVSPHRTVPG